MRCKRLLSLTLAAAMLFGSAALLPEGVFANQTEITASAAEVESGKCGENVFWSLDDKGVLTISGSGYMYDCYGFDGPTPYDAYHNDIRSVVIKSGVIGICGWAFNGFYKLSSVSIPDSIKSFSIGAFYDCHSLENITIPQSVESIGSETFRNCTSLKTVIIPKSVNFIGDASFNNCTALKSVTVLSVNAKIQEKAFGYIGAEKAEDFTVKCYKGSTAEKYAEDNGFTCEYLECSHDYEQTFVPETCGRGSYTLHTCKICGESYITDEVSPSGKIAHKYGDWIISQTPTSTEDGEEYRVCQVCQNKETRALDLEHAFCKCFKYKVLLDGTIKIVGFTTHVDGLVVPPEKVENLVIPSEIDGKTVTVIGNSAFKNYVFSLKSVTLPDTVTVIGDSAFYGCESLKTIKLSDNLRRIGDCAFHLCHRLSHIDLPDSLQYIGENVFYEAMSLESLNIPKNVIYIGRGVLPKVSVSSENKVYSSENGALFSKDKKTLYRCPWTVTSYKIPYGVTAIAEGAFSGLNYRYSGKDNPYMWLNLNSITIPDTVTYIGPNAFSHTSLKNVTIPKNVKTIGEYAFASTSISSITIPSSVKTIGKRAFSDCFLFSAKLPGGIKTIPEGLFAGCKFLEDINIPYGVTTIERSAFSNCSNIGGLVLPKSVHTIGPYAFAGCPDQSVILPNRPLVIGQGALDYPDYKNDLNIINGTLVSTNGYSKAQLNVPNGVHTIAPDAFRGCTATTLNISKTVAVININTDFGIFYPFTTINVDPANPYYCSVNGALYNKSKTKLILYPRGKTTFDIPKTVKTIGAFSCCGIAAETVNIPNGVTAVEERAFFMSSVKKITIPGTVNTIGKYVFNESETLTELIIGEGVKRIEEGAFLSAYRLQNVVIPKSVDYIGFRAFSPVEDIYAFPASPWIKSKVDKNNLVIINNILHEGSLFEGETLVIPNGVKTICSGAFSSEKNASIKRIVIPDTVETIESYAFIGCVNLERVQLPLTVKHIGYKAFGFYGEKSNEDSTINSINVLGSDRSFVNEVKGDSVIIRNDSIRLKCAYGSEGEKYAIENGFDYELTDTDISRSTVTADVAFYTGKPVYPAITVEINGKKLKKGTDYTVKYSDNVEKGTGKFIVTGMGRFSGTYSGTFVIGSPCERLCGDNRFGTAAEIAKAAYPTAETVILAFGLNYADALAGVPLAEKLKAPILLTNTKSIPKETTNAIEKLGAKNVMILGGEGAISKDVEDTLKAQGLKTKRLAGQSRFGTATAIAEELNDAPTDVIFVYAFNSADALSVSTVAALKKAPIIYLSTKGELNADTAAYLAKLKEKGCVKNAYVIGGKGVISNDMMNKAAAALGLKKAIRVAGQNRYETCTAVNTKFADLLTGDGICVAKGLDFPDALAGGVYAAATKQALFLADGKKLQDCQNSYLKSKNAGKITVFGGTGAVPDELVKLIAQASV